MNCEYSLLSTTNSDSQPYSRGIGSSPSLVKDEAKGTKQQSAVNVSDTVTALQKMQPYRHYYDATLRYKSLNDICSPFQCNSTARELPESKQPARFDTDSRSVAHSVRLLHYCASVQDKAFLAFRVH